MSLIGPAGFERDTLDELLAQNQEEIRSLFGTATNTSIESPEGALASLAARSEDRLLTITEDVYYSQAPASAAGASLDRVVRLSLIERRPEQRAIVECDFTGQPGAVFASGSVIASTGTGVAFENIEDVPLDGLGNAEGIAMRAIVAGTGGNVGAGEISGFDVALPGLATVTNPLRATGGLPIENDANLYARFLNIQAAAGTSRAALVTQLLETPGVEAVEVLANDTDETDADGLPPHSIECIIRGGAALLIAPVIFQHTAAPVLTFGSVAENVADATGKIWTVRYSVPTDRPVYVSVTISARSDIWEDRFRDAIRRNIVKLIGGTDRTGDEPLDYVGLKPGADVTRAETAGVNFGSPTEIYESIPGQLDQPEVCLGFAPSPSCDADFLEILPRDKAVVDTDDIGVEVELT